MKPYNKRARKPIGQILIEQGVINSAQLKQSLEVQENEGGLIGEIIVKLGFTTEENIAHCLSLQFGFPYLPLENYEISREVTGLIPKNVVSHYCLIPIDKIDNTLTVAMANPMNMQAIEDLEDTTKCEIQVFISTPSDIRGCIAKYYNK